MQSGVSDAVLMGGTNGSMHSLAAGNESFINAGIPQITHPPQEGTQQYCLRWNSYPATIATQLATLRIAEDFVDVTLACDGQQLRAHKLVLSACSPYFMQLFKSTPCQHPVVFLKDVRFCQLRALLEFMYAGEVNVSQTELPALLRTAEALQVRGLADTTNNNNFTTQLPPKPIFTQHQQYIPVPNPIVAQTSVPVQLPSIPSQPQQHLPPLQQQQSTQLQQPPIHMRIDQRIEDPSHMMSSDALTQSNSGLSSVLSKREVRDESLGNESSKENQMDVSSSDSNDSQDEYNVPCQFETKPSINHEPNLPPLNDNPFGAIRNTNSGVDSEQQRNAAMEQPDYEGRGHSIGGSQSEAESSENDDDDDDDGEIKDDYNFPSSEIALDYNHGQNLEESVNVNNNESIPGPSMTSSIRFTNNAISLEKSKDLNPPMNFVAPGVAPPLRNRLSRSLWPPGPIPYHGPQQCPYCPRILSNVGNWRKHVMTMHIAHEKNHKCRHCNSSFRTAEYLQKHYVRVHSYQPKSRKKAIGSSSSQNSVQLTGTTANSNPSIT